MGELILTVPPTTAGDIALRHLSRPNELGVTYRASLRAVIRDVLERYELPPGLDEATGRYHLVSVPECHETEAIFRILAFHDQEGGSEGRGTVAVFVLLVATETVQSEPAPAVVADAQK